MPRGPGARADGPLAPPAGPSGNIAVAVFVTAACCALIAGTLGDALPRRPLLVFFVLLSMGATLGTAWVRTYNQLLALRAVAGVALGTVPPLVYSALADIFPATRRNLATSLVTIAATAGTLVGQVISGYVGATGGWRRPFIILAVPCLFLTLLLPFVAREPSRGAAEPELRKRLAAAAAALAAAAGGGGAAQGGAAGRGASHDGATPVVEYGERVEMRKLARVFAVPTNLFIFAQSIPSCVPWGVLNTFVADYVAQNRRMGIVGATNALMVYAAGGLIGTLGGAALTQWLFNRRPHLVGFVVAVSTAAGIGPMLYIIRGAYGPGHFAPLGGSAFGAGILTCVAAPALRAAILCVNSPETRGSAFAILIFLDSLGRGLGPLGAASLSEKEGRMQAFTTSISLWAISAGFQAMLMGTLARDEAAMQAALRVAKLRGGTHALQEVRFEAPAGEDEDAGRPRRGESTSELLGGEEGAVPQPPR